MRRLGVVVVMLAAVLALVALSAPAQAQQVYMKTIQLKWAGTTPDTTFLQTEADTTRTLVYDFSDWAWESYGLGSGDDQINPFACATVTFVAATSCGVGANVGGDSIGYAFERVIKGGTCHFLTWTALTAQTMLGFVAATGQIAPILSLKGATSNVLYQGVLLADPDATPSPTNIWLATAGRLVVWGDSNASAPQLSGLKCYLTYPAHR